MDTIFCLFPCSGQQMASSCRTQKIPPWRSFCLRVLSSTQVRCKGVGAGHSFGTSRDFFKNSRNKGVQSERDGGEPPRQPSHLLPTAHIPTRHARRQFRKNEFACERHGWILFITLYLQFEVKYKEHIKMPISATV